MAANVQLALYLSAAVLLALGTIATGLRVYARTVVVRAFGVDDWLMLLTLALYSVYCAFVFYGTSWNKGLHTAQIPLDAYTPALMSFYFGEIFYILTAITLKLSVGAFLLRLLKARLQRWTVYITLIVVTLYSLVYCIMAIAQCTPIDHYWHPLSEGTCFSGSIIVGTSYAFATLISFSDFLFAAMPIFLVWNLQMNTFMKFSVASIMSLGAIAGVTTIVRVVYLKDISNNKDFFFSTAKLTIWSTVEPGVGIIIGSAAALRPLFKSLLGKNLFSSGNKYGYGYSSRGRKNTGPWQSSHSAHYQLESFKGVDDGVGERNIIRVEGGVAPTREQSKKGGAKNFGSVRVQGTLNDSQEELTTKSLGNIYKETSVERRVEIYNRDGDLAAAAHNQNMV
ncbi:hypothetical protein BP5796_09919 [Coleophoma crateriformis]|uniref:Rhodopsin domain-containing protein n=1 Tax=Coleophoma crateriformis TaxID=565419 RepID=A0A3D8QTX5_9HELO|nr:hypothetical protein BP5796_09919 [Coleophoma crateriformis]